MSFSLPRLLRCMQPSELQTYFAVRDITFSEHVDWIAKPGVLLHSLKAAIEALPERAREQVFADFERVDQLSDEIGQRDCIPSSKMMRLCCERFIPATASRHVVFSYFSKTKMLSIMH
jgi:hypothetical protein